MSILSDYHLHCNFSSDSQADPRQMIERAIALGLTNICFTDHNDFDYPLENGTMPFQLNFSEYITQIENLKKQYEDRICIHVGMEQGLQPHLAEKINAFDTENRLDFIIGSSHLVYGKDPYYPDFWKEQDVRSVIECYFESIVENMKTCHNFDVYGHLDYIIRYAPNKDKNYSWKDYSDWIDEILKDLIEHGKGIEINTAGLKYGLKEPNPCSGIISRYHELGGQIITIGSDAHAPEHLAYDFDKVPSILKDAGFDYYTIFNKRKPEFIRIH